MEKLRVGIIGVGNMGSNHLKRFIAGDIKNAELTALCDINKDNLYRFQKDLAENVQYFDDASKLIQSGLVDGVIIATPHYDHPVISIEALNAGLHVFCEKPSGVYTKNVREMNEVAAKSGKAFQVNFVLRTLDVYQKIKELVDNGELGTIKRIVWIITNWYRTQAYFDSGSWRATWAGEGGGTLLNQNPHNLDLFQWIGGMPKRVRASCYFGKNRNIEVEDEATAYFEYDNGAVGLYMTSVSEFPGTNRLEIAGTRGKLVYEDDKLTFYRTTISEEEFNRETKGGFGPIPMWKCDIPFMQSNVNDGQAKMINNWIDVALHGGKLIGPGEEGIHSLMISNGIYLSEWNDDWVDFPIDEEVYYQKLQEKIQNSVFVKQEATNTIVDMNSSFHK